MDLENLTEQIFLKFNQSLLCIIYNNMKKNNIHTLKQFYFLIRKFITKPNKICMIHKIHCM